MTDQEIIEFLAVKVMKRYKRADGRWYSVEAKKNGLLTPEADATWNPMQNIEQAMECVASWATEPQKRLTIKVSGFSLVWGVHVSGIEGWFLTDTLSELPTAICKALVRAMGGECE